MPRKKDKASNEKIHTDIMTSVASIVDFMKQQVVSNLVEAKSKGTISMEDETLRKVCFYVESSMTNSFTRASSQLEDTIKNIK